MTHRRHPLLPAGLACTLALVAASACGAAGFVGYVELRSAVQTAFAVPARPILPGPVGAAPRASAETAARDDQVPDSSCRAWGTGR